MERDRRRGPRAVGLLVLTAAVAAAPDLAAQGMPPAQVRYTAAREHLLAGSIRLPGTVESRTASLVASEVAGLVTALAAREGQAVDRGSPLVELRRHNLELRLTAVANQLREAEARLKLAELSLERTRELHQSEVISQQQLDEARYEADAWQGRVAQLAAEVARLEDDLARSTIRAPFAGVVVKEHTEVGEWVGVGDPVLEILSLAELEVRVDLPERYFGEVKKGQAARVRFEALPGREVEGRVSAVIPSADLKARTFPIKVRIPNRDGRIGAGMLAEVLLAAGEPYRATLVPKDAVVTDGGRRQVFLLDGDGTVRPVAVEVGAGVGGWVEVRGPVQPGDRAVVRGNERLRPGQAVEGQPLDYPPPQAPGDGRSGGTR